MESLNICIDIDGTITDPYYWVDIANKYFNKNVTEEQVTEYYVHKILGIERNEYEDFYAKNKYIIHSNEKMREDAVPVIQTLSLLHNIYFVTARDSELEMLTHLYLKKKIKLIKRINQPYFKRGEIFI